MFDFVFVLSLRLGLTTWFTPIVNHKRTRNLLDSGKNQEESKETTGLPQIRNEIENWSQKTSPQRIPSAAQTKAPRENTTGDESKSDRY